MSAKKNKMFEFQNNRKFNPFHSFKLSFLHEDCKETHLDINIFVHLMLYRIFNFINWKVSFLHQNQTERG